MKRKTKKTQKNKVLVSAWIDKKVHAKAKKVLMKDKTTFSRVIRETITICAGGYL